MTFEVPSGETVMPIEESIYTSDFSGLMQHSSTIVNPSSVYELNQSESLTFLYNLLYDEESTITKTDVLSILSSFKEREINLPFAITKLDPHTNVQGIPWGSSLRRKFYQERARVARSSWFTNVPNSREQVMKNVKSISYDIKTDFYQFQRFYSRLKNHITHFQLRSLVVCGDTLADGVYYPSSYFHDDTLEPVFLDSANMAAEDCHTFFKLIRMMPDEQSTVADAMKLDCMVDSQTLQQNCNSRISSMACSSKFVASGTFEGGFILADVEDKEKPWKTHEVLLTRSCDGITNDISISTDNAHLTIASNDAKLRYFDVEAFRKTATVQLPFAVNCLSKSPHNPNEFFVAADSKDNFILDKRCLNTEQFSASATFHGHKDYGFSCDWSPLNENLLVSGNQDGTVRLWDRRMCHESTHCWNSALGSHAFNIDNDVLGGPVRNCKFSYYGNHLVWAESLDHVGVVSVHDLNNHYDDIFSRVQSIDFIGKCIGLNVTSAGSGKDENLLIGINDCPLGGILKYRLDAPGTTLPFDFRF